MNSDILSQIASSRPTIKFCSLFNGLSPLWDYSLHSHPYMELIYRKKGFGKTALLDELVSVFFTSKSFLAKTFQTGNRENHYRISERYPN